MTIREIAVIGNVIGNIHSPWMTSMNQRVCVSECAHTYVHIAGTCVLRSLVENSLISL